MTHIIKEARESMYEFVTVFIITLIVVLLINLIGQKLIVNKGNVLERRTLMILIIQSLVITLLLGIGNYLEI